VQKIVILNGSGGTGKDTFSKLLGEVCYVENYSSVDEVKFAGKILGWNGCKYERDRSFLAELKDLATKYYDSPLKYMMKRISDFRLVRLNSDRSIICVHIREPIEIQKLKDQFNEDEVVTVLVVNSRISQILTNEADANVFDFAYDYIVQNDGDLSKLKDSAEIFVNDLFDVKCKCCN